MSGLTFILLVALATPFACGQRGGVPALQAQIDALTGQTGSLQAQIDALEAAVAALQSAGNGSSATVAFTAWLSTPSVAMSGDTIQFNQIINNVGGGFDATTGIFTAPAPGIYFFYVHLDVTADFDTIVLAVNDVEVLSSEASGSATTTPGTTVTMACVLDLAQNDQVKVRHDESTGTANGGFKTNFSGFLVGPSE